MCLMFTAIRLNLVLIIPLFYANMSRAYNNSLKKKKNEIN